MYTIEGLKITDSDLIQKLEDLLEQEKLNIEPEKYYHLKVIYRDRDIAALIDSNQKENAIKDQIYKITSENLKHIEQFLERYNIKICASEIVGRKLEESKVILDLAEAEPFLDRKKVIKVSTIMPDESFILETMSEMVNKNLSKVYADTVQIFGRELLCEVLNIPKTNKDKVIYSAFFDQHRQLGFIPSKEDIKKFEDKVLRVVESKQNKE